ncbi:MAG: hypothetical protein RL226_1639 [Bacteroidota bacterium]
MLAVYFLYKQSASLIGFPLLITSYFADILALPIILAIAEDVLRLFYGDYFRLTRRMVIATALYVGVMFEWLLPRYGIGGTADVLDVVCYLFGALFFLFLKKETAPKGGDVVID